MNFSQTFLIYKNTLQKEVRSKMLIFLMFATIGIILLSKFFLDIIFEHFFSHLEPKNFGPVALEVFLYGSHFWTSFLAIFLGVGTVRSDLEDGVLRQLLSFPVKRFEYLMARIAGVSSIVLSFYLFSLAFFLVFFAGEWGIQISWMSFFEAFLFNICFMTAAVALAVFVSLLAKGLVALGLSCLLALLIFLYNNVFKEIEIDLAELWNSEAFYSLAFALGLILHFCFPRIGTLGHVSIALFKGREISLNWWGEICHFVVSFAVLGLVTAWFLRRKEI